MPAPIWRNPNSPEAILDDGIERLRRIRGVSRVMCERVDRRPFDADLLAIVVYFRETWERSASFLPLGENMPDSAEIRDWLRVIERDVREVMRRVDAQGCPSPHSGMARAMDYARAVGNGRRPEYSFVQIMYGLPETHHMEIMRQLTVADNLYEDHAPARADPTYHEVAERTELLRQMIAMGAITADDPERAAQREKAEARAADLFKLVAGQEAFDTLNAGKPLPITGSEGTAYTLHKRQTYCVRRSQDGAKLCAMVPGVPLWDHLLGIKLIIEHDEPRFLATANVERPIGMDMLLRRWIPDPP